jgi:hypothetical protein
MLSSESISCTQCNEGMRSWAYRTVWKLIYKVCKVCLCKCSCDKQRNRNYPWGKHLDDFHIQEQSQNRLLLWQVVSFYRHRIPLHSAESRPSAYGVVDRYSYSLGSLFAKNNATGEQKTPPSEEATAHGTDLRKGNGCYRTILINAPHCLALCTLRATLAIQPFMLNRGDRRPG